MSKTESATEFDTATETRTELIDISSDDESTENLTPTLVRTRDGFRRKQQICHYACSQNNAYTVLWEEYNQDTFEGKSVTGPKVDMPIVKNRYYQPKELLALTKEPGLVRFKNIQSLKRGSMPLGSGGFGTVWSNRRSAFKLITSRRGVKPLLLELSATRRMIDSACPYTVAVKSIGLVAEDGFTLSLVVEMDHIHGVTLREWLKTHRVISEVRAQKLMVQLLDALNCLHIDRWVHRDIKPSNIMIDRHNDARLIDFGIATRINSEYYSELVGTPGYIAPHAYENWQAADVWSMGRVFQQILDQSDWSTSPSPLAIVERMLQEDPRERPTVEEVLNSITGLND